MARRVKATSTKAKTTRAKKQPVEIRNVAHPKVYKTALKLAGGDPKKLTVVSYSEIAVIMD